MTKEFAEDQVKIEAGGTIQAKAPTKKRRKNGAGGVSKEVLGSSQKELQET